MTAATRCIGFRLYSRHPDRLGRWYACHEAANGNAERCQACESHHVEARARETEDGRARAKVRTVLASALEPVAEDYPLMFDRDSVLNMTLRRLATDIEVAVKATGELGGSGNYWLAFRVLLGLD